MTHSAIHRAGRLFDVLETRWEGVATQRRVATSLVVIFGVGLLLVELRRLGWVAPELAARLPSNHFEAILLPFTLLLLAEVVSLVFALAQVRCIRGGKAARDHVSHLDPPAVQGVDLFPRAHRLGNNLATAQTEDKR